jgi:hypothetical protein
MDHKRLYGDDSRPGALQRLGSVLMGLSLIVILVGFQIAPTASFVYIAVIAAHVLLYAGFATAAAADAVVRRPFEWMRLVLVLLVALCYGVVGPILMSAVAATQRVDSSDFGQ